MRKAYQFLKKKTFLKFLLLILGVLFAILFVKEFNTPEIKAKQKTQNKSTEIKKLIDKADLFFEKGQYQSAYHTYNEAVFLCKPIDHYVDDYVYALLSQANIQQNSSDFIACEESLTKILPYLKKTKKRSLTYNTYTILAYNYYFTYDNKNALLYHKKALKLASTSYKKAVIINDISLIYQSQGKYKEVVDLLEPLAIKKIKHKSDSQKTDNSYSLLLNSLGYCYYKTGNPKALDCIKKALEIQLGLNENFELVSTYNILSLLYAEKDPKISKIYAEKQYDAACKVNSSSFKANALASLIEKSKGRELKKYSETYMKIIDSIINGRQQAQNQFSTIKYTSKIDKEENLRLKILKAENDIQIERQKNRNIISYVIIVFAIGLTIFLTIYLFLKRKKEKNTAILESERRISKKLHDELANDVYETLAYAKNTDLEIEANKENFLINLDAIYARTRNISRENSVISTNENYPFALREMISDFKMPELNILLNGFDDISWNKIEKNKKIVLYRVLQELLFNMKKHSQATLVSIVFKREAKNLTVLYTDNGNRFNGESLSIKTGLQNIESLIKTINGSVTFDNTIQKGFKLRFTFRF
jgi:signal transduction histidine kinase